MSKMIPNPPPGFEELSVADQIDYVQALWEWVAASPAQVPVPDWHRRILQERLEAYKAAPGAGRPWQEVRTAIEQKLSDRRRG